MIRTSIPNKWFALDEVELETQLGFGVRVTVVHSQSDFASDVHPQALTERARARLRDEQGCRYV